MDSILEMSEEGFASNSGKMLTDVETFTEAHLNQPLRDINLGEVLNKLLEMLRNNRLRMKGSFYLGITPAGYALRQIEGKYHPTRIFLLARKLFGEGLDFL